MEVKLYVGNFPYETTEDDLRALFIQAGAIASVTMIKDRDTGQSKGFAFITMGSQGEAQRAINTFNGYKMGDRELKVNTAKAREEQPRGGYNDYNNNRGRRPGGGKRPQRGGGGGNRRY